MDKEAKPDRKKSGKRLPINLVRNEKTVGTSGFIIVRLAAHIHNPSEDLRKLPNFGAILKQHEGIVIQRLIRSVDPETLRKMEKQAATSEFPPLHSLTSYWRIDCRTLETSEMQELLKKLQQLPEVDHAYLEQRVIEPVVNASNDYWADFQGYLSAAETGIDARWAWEQGDCEGAGVGFIDLEQGWFLHHEDLVDKAPALIFNDINVNDPEYQNHGTAVLGAVVGVDNCFGIVGVAPGVTSVQVVSHYDAYSESSNVAEAITTAMNALAPGDVLLLEVQSVNYCPVENDDVVWDAIRLASAIGVIVIEPAGNGNRTLDTRPDGTRWFDPTNPLKDSGAIMIGACAEEPHNRFDGSGVGSGSNYGNRVNCFAWGEGIVTAGYGDIGGTNDNNNYTNRFGGTSGASAIIAGAALILQGKYQAISPGGGRLSPTQMRTLLSDRTTGTAQRWEVIGSIRVMPNLRAIIQDKLGLSPDVYLRDAVGDTGEVPSAGSISASPDIIVRPALVDDPDSEFLGIGRDDSNSLGFSVEFGQDNYIYVRMRNRNIVDANNTTATVYWSESSTLVTPDRWIGNRIGTTPPVNVPAGDTLVVAGPIIWRGADIPAGGHYCFVAILDQSSDLKPPVPSETDWDGFCAFIRNNNNVTWRNLNVIDNVPDPSIQAFMMTGAPDRGRLFDVEIIRRLPEKANVVLEVPLALFANLPDKSFLKAEIDRKEKIARLALPHLRSFVLENVKLRKGARYPCRLIITGLKGQKSSGHSIAIRQIFEEQEVGRITWAFEEKRGEARLI